MLPEKNDPELWLLFKAGDMPSFQTIYLNYFNSLYQYGLRIITDKELVKDAIHDLFVKLWKNKAHLSDVQSVKSYLFVALRQGLMNNLQRNKKIQLVQGNNDAPFDMLFSADQECLDKESRAIQTRELINALNKLSPRQKEVIYLRYFEEVDYEQIAGVMNISVKAVYKLRAEVLKHFTSYYRHRILLCYPFYYR